MLWGTYLKQIAAVKAADALVAETITALSQNTQKNRQIELFKEYYQRTTVLDPLLETAADTLRKIVTLNENIAKEEVVKLSSVSESSRLFLLVCGVAAVLFLAERLGGQEHFTQLGGELKWCAAARSGDLATPSHSRTATLAVSGIGEVAWRTYWRCNERHTPWRDSRLASWVRASQPDLPGDFSSGTVNTLVESRTLTAENSTVVGKYADQDFSRPPQPAKAIFNRQWTRGAGQSAAQPA